MLGSPAWPLYNSVTFPISVDQLIFCWFCEKKNVLSNNLIFVFSGLFFLRVKFCRRRKNKTKTIPFPLTTINITTTTTTPTWTKFVEFKTFPWFCDWVLSYLDGFEVRGLSGEGRSWDSGRVGKPANW